MDHGSMISTLGQHLVKKIILNLGKLYFYTLFACKQLKCPKFGLVDITSNLIDYLTVLTHTLQ